MLLLWLQCDDRRFPESLEGRMMSLYIKGQDSECPSAPNISARSANLYTFAFCEASTLSPFVKREMWAKGWKSLGEHGEIR